jgi:hypothetical protein
MWRDELNPWLIIRDSESFADLIGNIRYEGHPVLWYFSLALLRKVVDHPIIMQLFHLSLAIASVTIFWLYSPFKYRQKLLFTFGYLPFYEFLLISRNYAYGMLFISTFCAFFPTRKKTYIFLATFLGLMANSNAYSLFISFGLLITLIVELCFDSEHRNEYFSKAKKYDFLLSSIIVIFAYLLAVSIIVPPADSYLHGGLNDGWSIKMDIHHLFKTMGRFFGGYFLIIPSSKKWLDLIVCTLISFFTIIVTAIKLSKKPVPLFFYVFVNLQIITFAYFRFSGVGFRHFGHFYLIFIAALWLESYYQESHILHQKFKFLIKPFKFAQKWQHIILMVTLYAQFFGGIYGFTRDLVVPYSASHQTSEYIRKSNLDNEFIVASRDANMAALSGYLNRKFYYPELQKMGSFTLFKQGRENVDHAEVIRQVNLLLENDKYNNKVLMILHRELELKPDNLKIIPIKYFEKAWIDTERFYLYWAQKP